MNGVETGIFFLAAKKHEGSFFQNKSFLFSKKQQPVSKPARYHNYIARDLCRQEDSRAFFGEIRRKTGKFVCLGKFQRMNFLFLAFSADCCGLRCFGVKKKNEKSPGNGAPG
ncbi:MAG: hypothetical protein J6L72_03505, partial [Butyricicoccus sp.]|nr:hypothetical protein [Butyricicoccus sp.]